jgi:hypothetical protein
MIKKHTTRAQRQKGRAVLACLAALGLAALGALVPGVSRAQSFPTTYEIAEMPIQRTPTTFKFQTRISQAKVPVGDAVFKKLIINIKSREGETLCTEERAGVRVHDSVLNLEFGITATCPLDDLIANRDSLGMQICLNDSEHCLKSIAFSTVPYAVKSSYAAQAQQAYQSDVSAQCNYAHRVTADRDLFITKEIGAGYYDFHTPTALDGLGTGFNNVEGYVQWTPVTPGGAKALHLCAKDNALDKPVPLSDLYFHAAKTTALGNLFVSSDVTVGRDLRVEGLSTFVGAAKALNGLTVEKSANVSGGLGVTGLTALHNGVQIDGVTTASLGITMDVTGTSMLRGKTTVTAGGLDVTGTSTLRSGLSVTGDVTTESIKATSGTTTINGNLKVTGLLTLPGGVSAPSNSVNSAVIIDNSITSADILNNSVAGIDILDNTLTASDIGTGAVGSDEIADGSINL